LLALLSVAALKLKTRLNRLFIPPQKNSMKPHAPSEKND
jgi:hypothetical protein